MAKTLRTRTALGWTTKPPADLPENRLTSIDVDDNFLAMETAGASSIFNPGKSGGTISSSKLEYAAHAAGATLTPVNVTSGAGYISSLFLAFSTTNEATWRTGLIKVYYDGASTPAISMEIQRFFCNVYMGGTGAKTIFNEFFGFNASASANTAGMFLNFPMPFSNGIKIEITNGGSVSQTVWATATIHTGVPNAWGRTGRLLAKDFFVSAAAPNSVQTFINETSLTPGRLVMLWMLSDGFPGTVSPAGAELEGNVKIYRDGAGSPNYESSGTEDYFLLSFYGANVATGAWGGEVGMTFRNSNTTTSFYRQHIRNPIEFDSALKITWNCGDTSQVSFTGNARVWATVFYYVSV